MINTINLLGLSRSGKSALIPLLTCADNTDLPHNTPDLDWFIEMYQEGSLEIDPALKICVQYMLCYSWYSYLGRHINLRNRDYFSLQRLKPEIDFNIRNLREDNDIEFTKFLQMHERGEMYNIFMFEIPIEMQKKFEADFPINSHNIYCFRNPFAMVTQWSSSNRIQRSSTFSRMFKFTAMNSITNDKLSQQFTRTNNALELNIKSDRYQYNDPSLEDFIINDNEILFLRKLIDQQFTDAEFWSKKGNLVHYEHVVSEPETTLSNLSVWPSLKIKDENLRKSIDFMGKRPIETVLEQDRDSIIDPILKSSGDKDFAEFVYSKQMQYIKHFY